MVSLSIHLSDCYIYFRDQSFIRGKGGGGVLHKARGWRAGRVLPLQTGGGGSYSHAEGGHNKFLR